LPESSFTAAPRTAADVDAARGPRDGRAIEALVGVAAEGQRVGAEGAGLRVAREPREEAEVGGAEVLRLVAHDRGVRALDRARANERRGLAGEREIVAAAERDEGCLERGEDLPDGLAAHAIEARGAAEPLRVQVGLLRPGVVPREHAGALRLVERTPTRGRVVHERLRPRFVDLGEKAVGLPRLLEQLLRDPRGAAHDDAIAHLLRLSTELVEHRLELLREHGVEGRDEHGLGRREQVRREDVLREPACPMQRDHRLAGPRATADLQRALRVGAHEAPLRGMEEDAPRRQAGLERALDRLVVRRREPHLRAVRLARERLGERGPLGVVGLGLVVGRRERVGRLAVGREPEQGVRAMDGEVLEQIHERIAVRHRAEDPRRGRADLEAREGRIGDVGQRAGQGRGSLRCRVLRRLDGAHDPDVRAGLHEAVVACPDLVRGVVLADVTEDERLLVAMADHAERVLVHPERDPRDALELVHAHGRVAVPHLLDRLADVLARLVVEVLEAREERRRQRDLVAAHGGLVVSTPSGVTSIEVWRGYPSAR
jgi:hypothetical protein